MPDEISDTPTKSNRLPEGDQWINEHIGWMLALAYRILKDYSLAEDAVQDAFLSAFRAQESFQGRSSLKTWLHRITVNAALMKLRQLKRLAEQPIDDHLLPQFDQYECRVEQKWNDILSTEEAVASDQRLGYIDQQINQLPDSYRIVLLLRDIEGYSTHEAAVLLDISEPNVKVRLHRARSALKVLLEPLLRGEVDE